MESQQIVLVPDIDGESLSSKDERWMKSRRDEGETISLDEPEWSG